MIDFLASEVHYASHLAGIWHALDPSERGTFTVHPRILLHARKMGIETTRAQGTGSVCVVASYADERRVKRRPIVLLEHGAGQNYEHGAAGHPSYSGGARHDVVLFLCPNETVAQRWRECYPDSRVEVIGAEPRMDRYYRDLSAKENSKKDRSRRGWHPGTGGRRTRPSEDSQSEVDLLQGPRSSDGSRRGGLVRAPNPPVVAFAFHWPGHNVVPEAGNAWPTFGPYLGAITKHFTVLGHGHPRVIKTLSPYYERMGIEVVEDADEVFERADLLAVDNSSVLFEWASLDRPVVLLNSPAYRRDVHHGLRFWTFADIGPQVDDPADLVDACRRAVIESFNDSVARRRMADATFPVRDGCASERAAAAIRNLVSSPVPLRRTRMPNTDPYAPRSRGTARRVAQVPEASPSAPEVDTAPQEDGFDALAERLRTLGGDDAYIDLLAKTWQQNDEDGRQSMLSQYDQLTDDEIGDVFHERRTSSALTGVVSPRQENNG